MAKSNVFPLDLGKQTYRKDMAPARSVGADIVVMTNDPSDINFDENTNTTQIPLPDGSISISVGPPQQIRKKDLRDLTAI